MTDKLKSFFSYLRSLNCSSKSKFEPKFDGGAICCHPPLDVITKLWNKICKTGSWL